MKAVHKTRGTNIVGRRVFVPELRPLCGDCNRRIALDEFFLVADPKALGEGGRVFCYECAEVGEWRTGTMLTGAH